MPPLWRLREVQAFVAFLRSEPARMLTAESMLAYIFKQPESSWWALIAESIETLGAELDGKAAPVADIIEWLGEWMRDVRQEQRGLTLLTAHRAKGLEFEDVVILDGGWDRTSTGEDKDAARRLFYVAMTRPRRSLAIVAMKELHPILQTVAAALLQRQVTVYETARQSCSLKYQTVEASMVDLGFSGRRPVSNPIFRALSSLRTGDPIELAETDGQWLLRNHGGATIGRMARSYRPPQGHQFVRGSAKSIVRWRKTDGSEEFRGALSQDEWEVVLPEFVFAPR